METPQRQTVEIKPVASYVALDSEGYIVNPASLEKIQKEWRPAVDMIVDECLKHFGKSLTHVYIRGSVPRGLAVPYISDIDALVYVSELDGKALRPWRHQAEEAIQTRYLFVEKIELSIAPLATSLNDAVVLNQAVCVYGEPIEVPKLKPGKELMRHLPHLEQRMERFIERFAHAHTPEEVRMRCVWLMKDMLRSGFELTMVRANRYTRDLYKCYESFAEYYPEMESEMRRILYLALNPTDNRNEILGTYQSMVPWLKEEASRVLADLE